MICMWNFILKALLNADKLKEFSRIHVAKADEDLAHDWFIVFKLLF